MAPQLPDDNWRSPRQLRAAARELLATPELDLWAPEDIAVLRAIAGWQIPPEGIVEAGRKVIRFRRSGGFQDVTNAIGELEDVIEAGGEE